MPWELVKAYSSALKLGSSNRLCSWLVAKVESRSCAKHSAVSNCKILDFG